MRICHIREEYVEYLRQKEPNVFINKNESRPYVGIVLTINDYTYYVPLSSPKVKHKKMKNTKDFHKIANGSYGVINFNRMIPVPKECIIHFDFANEPNALYRALLQKQYRYISDIEDVIIKKSNNIYNIFNKPDNELSSFDLKIKKRCCDFELLEKMCDIYCEKYKKRK